MYALTDSVEELLGQPIRGMSVNAMMHCPLHEDRTPSFSIHLEDGVFHCFSCGESGTINKLYRLLGKEVSLGVRFAQAKRRAEYPELTTHNFAALANGYIQRLRLEGEEDIIQGFLGDRPININAIRHFGVGYASDRDALSFPYTDKENRVTGIKYRYRDGFKASETGSSYGLYGLANVIGRDTVILCEGESDTLAVWTQYGRDYGVGGTSGASVSDTQWSRFGLHLLFARTIYLLYDADKTGDDCAEIAMRVLGSDKCVRLRPTDGANDACDFIAKGGRLETLGLEGIDGTE